MKTTPVTQLYKCANCFHSFEHVNRWGLCRQCERQVRQRDAEYRGSSTR